MRLTLRTLLAYLDDTLEARQAREIGQKVAESPSARELIERIRQVTRRRRLGALSPTGGDPEFDANVVAQYLDISLSSEEIARIEEKCLADDLHLAEVAACHQILTQVLGDPARVPPIARERMYELVPDSSVGSRRKAGPTPIGDGAFRKIATHEDTDEKLLLGLPMRAEGPRFSWWPPVVAAVLLVGALVALWMSIGTGGGELTQLTKNGSDKIAAAPPVVPPVEPPVDPIALENKEKRLKESDVAKQVAVVPKLETTPVPSTSVEPAIHKPAPEKVPVMTRPPRTAPPGRDRIELGRPALVAGSANLLVQRERNDPIWKRLAPEKGRVFATDQLMMLPGYRGEIRFDSGVHLLLWGSVPELSKSAIPVLESQVTVNALPGLDLDLTLQRGRLLLSNHKSEGPVVVRIRFADEVWDVTLSDANTEVGLELVAACVPYTTTPGSGEPEVDVALLVLKGEASLKSRYEEFLLQSNTLVTWDSVNGPAPRPQALRKLPPWYVTKSLPTTQAGRESSMALEGLSRISATKTLDVALAEFVRAADLASRILGARCLAALGDVPALVNAINDEKRPELRNAAVEGLRHLFGVDPQSERHLERIAREKGYTETQVVTIRQLLHGFAPKQWEQGVVRSTVVDYLMHDKLVIRQLAYNLLLRMFPEGQRIGYDAAAEVRKRERWHEEWKTLVQPPQRK